MKVRTEARRSAILETARKIFLEHGFEGASMSEISRAVGGSKATIYGYFASKEELFVAATDLEGGRMLEALLSELQLREGVPLRDVLLSFGEALIGFIDSEAAVSAYRMVMAEAGRSEVGQRFYEQGPKAGLDQLARLLRSAMVRGELRQADAEIAALHLHGLLNSELLPRLFSYSARPMSKERTRAVVKRAVDVFLSGYGTERSS